MPISLLQPFARRHRTSGQTIEREFVMSFIKHSFVWQFAAGFAIGAIGFVTLHAAPAKAAAAPTELVRR